VVAAETVNPSTLFVFRETKQIVTMEWLFENGYSKSDCDSVEDRATNAQERLAAERTDWQARASELKGLCTTVDQALDGVDSETEAVRAAIESSVAEAVTMMTAAMESRRDELIGELEARQQRRRAECEERLEALRSNLGVAEAHVASVSAALDDASAVALVRAELDGKSVAGSTGYSGGLCDTAASPASAIAALQSLAYSDTNAQRLREAVTNAVAGFGMLGPAVDTEVLSALLPDGVDPNHPDENGRTAVWHAAHCGLFAILLHLVDERGASIMLPDNDGRTPLYAAAGHDGGGGHLDVVKWLAGNGGSGTPPNNSGDAPLNVAARNGHLDVVQWLRESGTN
jgi:hypothetical protein